MKPVFSIIITCYNHLRFLDKMLVMINDQSFREFEVIIIDNNSKDGSVEKLKTSIFKDVKVVFNTENVGLCKAFNQGVKLSNGKYLIDLSPDDLFLPHKLQENYQLLEQENAHLLFSDCKVVNVDGSSYLHSQKYRFDYQGKGNYFCEIVSKHCLASLTTVVSRECFDAVGGYDESLAYEDFDFMTKASKCYDIIYDSQVLMVKQESKNSLSSNFQKRKSNIHLSTLKVCQKLKSICDSKEEKIAFKKRVYYEMKAQLKLLNFGLVIRYLNL